MFDITHIITTIDRGGAEKHLLQLASAQVAKGFRVRVVFLKGNGELLSDFESGGCSVVTYLSNRNILVQILELRKILEVDCGVIHAHLPRAELLTAIVSRNKFIVSRHNAEKFFPGAPDFLSRHLSRFVETKTYGCIAISQSVENFLIQSKEWSLATPIHVIYYGYEKHSLKTSVSRTELLKKLSIPETSYIIGTIARLAPQKDYPNLLQAFKLFLEIEPNSYLIAVGDGELLDGMRLYATQLEIAHRIKWIGKIANVEDYLQLFDVFVLTSQYEGFGLVLLEAANANLPIIASNISAIPEVLGPEYKYLAEVGEYRDFYSKLKLLRFTEDSDYFVENNKEILSRFTVEKMLNDTLKTYINKKMS